QTCRVVFVAIVLLASLAASATSQHNLTALFVFFFFIVLRVPKSTLFPYTTLFRSCQRSQITSRSSENTCNDVLHRWNSLRTLLRSEEHTSELQSRENLVCRLLLVKIKLSKNNSHATTFEKVIYRKLLMYVAFLRLF